MNKLQISLKYAFISNRWKCDGVNDCGDNSDELGCTSNITTPTSIIPDEGHVETETCMKNQFLCDNGRCISKSYVCDGYPDCDGGEDEANCPKTSCGRDKFRCRSDGVCLDRIKYCDGETMFYSYSFFWIYFICFELFCQNLLENILMGNSFINPQEFFTVSMVVTKKIASNHQKCKYFSRPFPLNQVL